MTSTIDQDTPSFSPILGVRLQWASAYWRLTEGDDDGAD